MIKTDSIDIFAKDLYNKIRLKGSDIEMRAEENKPVKDKENPIDARQFQFKYADNFVITMQIKKGTGGNLGSLTVIYDGSLPKTWNPEQRTVFKNFLIDLKNFCQPNFSFDVNDISVSKGLDSRNYKHREVGDSQSNVLDKDQIQAPPDTSASMMEGRLTGSRFKSYEDRGRVRIVVKHKRAVEDTIPGDRSRNIESIYLENDLGERFRLPEGTNINGARAYARHLLEGGALHDEFGQHITKMIQEMNDLRGFVRNMRGRQFEDAETSAMVEAAIDHYGAIHRDLFMLRGPRGYQQYRALWQPEQPLLDEFDIEGLKERFVKKVFDDRLTRALPIVHRAYEARKNLMGEEFESWADQVIEQGLEEDILPSTSAGNMSPLSSTSPKPDPMDDPHHVHDMHSPEFDSDSADENLDKLLSDQGFDFFYQDGTYWFTSKEELSRARDILTKTKVDSETVPFNIPEMGVRDNRNQKYGPDTNYRTLPGHGVMEDLDSIRRLSGLG